MIKLSANRSLFDKCSVTFCSSTDVELHHVRKLLRRYNGGIVTVETSKPRTGLSGKEMDKALESALKATFGASLS